MVQKNNSAKALIGELCTQYHLGVGINIGNTCVRIRISVMQSGDISLSLFAG